MFNLFFFILLNGVYNPLDVGEIPPFDTFAECTEVGQIVVDDLSKRLRHEQVKLLVGKLVWICEEIA